MVDILQIKPGKCRNISQEVVDKCSSADWVMEEKIDGHRGLLHMGVDLDRAYLTSRRVSSVTGMYSENGENVPHILEEADAFVDERKMGYTVLDGEVVVDGFPFEGVQSVMGSRPCRAHKWQKDNAKASFIAYDILFLEGTDLRKEPYYMRILALKDIVTYGYFDHIRRSKSLPVVSGVREYFNSIVAGGGEGIIVKDIMAKYGQGMWKMKEETTFDVVVSGFQDGKGKFRNLVGAVEFSCWDGDTLVGVGKCSGMPDGDVIWDDPEGDKGKSSGNFLNLLPGYESEEGTRAWFTRNKGRIVGTVIEVKANGLTAKGKLRHPRFLRVRRDKSKEMCSLPRDQMKES